MLIIGAVALIAFGPDQLPKVARRAGQVMRDVQNTSQSFIREMERAADEPAPHAPWTPPPPETHEATAVTPSAVAPPPTADAEAHPSTPSSPA
jgi:Sec-independent protein translocase protein TatA